MIDPAFYLVFTLLLISFTNFAFPRSYAGRYIMATIPGTIILAYAAWQALALAIVSYLVFFTLFIFSRKSNNKNIKNFLPYAGLLLVFYPDYSAAIANKDILFLGSAFIIIRQFVTAKECIKQDSAIISYVLSSGLATFFFASLFTGPVFSGLDANTKLGKKQAADNSLGLFKILEGFVFILPLSQYVSYCQTTVSAFSQPVNSPALIYSADLVATPILAFLFVFTTFFGYSKVAEGVAHLFGFNVPVNFNQPHKSINFSDFWQRWHRSMADFVMKYLYLPISIHLKNPKLGLLGGFVFMGWWHNLSLGYFVWGIAHGSALIWLQPKLREAAIPLLLKRFLTLSFVIYVSYLANHWL